MGSEPASPPPPTGTAGTGPDLFVGRRSELEVMEGVWAAVTQGHRRAVFIGGEPGIGKSGLAAQVASTLQRHGATVLWGASYPDVEVPYRPLVAALESVIHQLGHDAVRTHLGTDLPLFAGLVPSLVGGPAEARNGAPTAVSSLPLFDAVGRLLASLAEPGPVVLVLEDLHWAGPPTIQMLKHLVRSQVAVPLLVIATHRTTAPDRTATLTHAIADLYALPGSYRLDLAGLSADDIADYLSGQLSRPREQILPAAAVLRDETDGNPFLLRELWRDAERAGGDILSSLRAGAATAPATVRDTIDRRLADLSPAHVEVVELAAVAGQTCDLATIASAGGREPETLLDAVDVAVAAGLLIADDDRPGVFSFRHALVRQAVLDRLSPSALAKAHAALARTLAATPVQEPELVARLAHHYEAAQALGHVPEAVTYLTRAARHAEQAAAHGDAAELYRRAATLPATQVADRDGLWLAVARCQIRAGEFPAARELTERLARSTDPVVAVRAGVLHEDASWRPGYDGQRSLELLETALASYPDDRDDPLRVRALASYSRALSFTGQDTRARDTGDEALRRARENGDEELLSHALACTLWRGVTPAHAPILLARATELATLARRRHDLDDHLGHAGFYRAVFSYMTGDPEGWHAGAEDVASAARRTGEPFMRYVDSCTTYAHAFAHGDLSTARIVLDELGGYAEVFGPLSTEGSHAVQTFMVERAAGRLDRVDRYISGDESVDAHWAPGLLALYVALGRDDAARRVLPSVVESLRSQPLASAQRAGVLAFAADAAVALGSRDAADVLRDLLTPYAGLNLVAGQFVAVFGAADRYLAMLDGLLERPGVEDGFAAALARDRQMGAVLHQIETLNAWASYLQQGAPSATAEERARRTRQEADALSAQVGYARSVRGRPGRAAATLPAQLTLRELDVLRLVSAGRSNREIGDELHISSNTAANHVRSILMKTGASNRTSAAMFASEHGLLGSS